MRADVNELGIECAAGEQPALLHAFVGVYEEGGYEGASTQAMSDEFNALLDSVRGIAGLPVSAVSGEGDANPQSPSAFVLCCSLSADCAAVVALFF